MGPKNAPATCGSLPSKDLSWIDRVYLKFENMCVEVDKNPSILLQETSKYVESQMNVVGANVKKLCTELIQDLLPPPILSLEGTEKQSDCAVHCKCSCMDSVKPKQTAIKGRSTKAESEVPQFKGSTGENEKSENFSGEKQNLLKRGDMKTEERNAEVATHLQEVKTDCDLEGNVEENRKNGMHEGTKHVVNVNEMGHCDEFQEQSEGTKIQHSTEGKEHEDSCGQIESSDRNIKEDENALVVVQCRGEFELSGQASRGSEELSSSGKELTAQMKNLLAIERENRSLDVREQQPVMETHESRLKGRLIASDRYTQKVAHKKVALHEIMDANDLKCMYGSVSSGEDTEVAGVQESGGDLRVMYSYIFSEGPRPHKVEDSMTMSGFLHEEQQEDEEQSAHWFVGEDVRNILEAERFIDRPRQAAESLAKETDSDWELL